MVRLYQNCIFPEACSKNCVLQIGNPSEEDLVNWGWHFTTKTLPDDIMKKAAGEEVSCDRELLHAQFCNDKEH